MVVHISEIEIIIILKLKSDYFTKDIRTNDVNILILSSIQLYLAKINDPTLIVNIFL